ncbi:MAG TPA: DUF4240 domain-containing protein [Gemmatales bacterium]|nr:DUF4240 domain-containing protein [Gemmatales bacterium]
MKPQIDDWFWELLESSQGSLRLLCRKIEQLPRQRVIDYHRLYEEAKSSVNPLCREDDVTSPDDDCSEDGADDFAAWVVMQGKSLYERAVHDPLHLALLLKSFQEHEAGKGALAFGIAWDNNVDRKEYGGYQRADYIAAPIYRTRFGEELAEVS